MPANAIEQGKKLLDATSAEQDARMIAGLIHGLGSDLKASRYTQIANRITDDKPFARMGPEGEQYVISEDGKAETPKGEKCESWGQRLEKLNNGIADLWKEAEDSGLGTKKVEDELRKLQDKANEEAASPSPNGAEAAAQPS